MDSSLTSCVSEYPPCLCPWAGLCMQDQADLWPPFGGSKHKENTFPTEINKDLSIIAAIKNFHLCSVVLNEWGFRDSILRILQWEDESSAIVGEFTIWDLLIFTWTPSCLQLLCVSCASTPQRNVSSLLPSSCPPLLPPPTRSSCPSSLPLMTWIWVHFVVCVSMFKSVCEERWDIMQEDRNIQQLACRNKAERHTVISMHMTYNPKSPKDIDSVHLNWTCDQWGLTWVVLQVVLIG